ncbi:MAG TPA: branched-chain amino acid ABC transporter permease [Geminicoccaceae bacterium]
MGRTILGDRTLIGLMIAALLMAALGFVLPDWAIFLTTIAVAKAMVVLGLLILWRTGLVSFGQALYFGAGGYAAGLAGRYLGLSDAILLVLLGGIVAAVVAWVIGLLLARYREIFFAMLSLAFSMILYGVLVKTEALGSTDGINIISPTFLGYAPVGDAQIFAVYLFTILLGLFAAGAVRIYLQSTIGMLANPIRDNEIRVEYLGISVRGVIHLKVVIAGGLAGIGGVLTALAVGHIDPEMAYWTTSGGFVFVTILAGTGSVAAPFVGSLLFETIRSFAMEYAPETWQIVLGSALLATILFLPNGLWSLLERRRRPAAPQEA